MGCDMVVALAWAAVEGHTLLGQNCAHPIDKLCSLRRLHGRVYAQGEKLRTQHEELPQARETFAVVGCQVEGCWGYEVGVNEHRVAVGCSPLSASRCRAITGLLGTDLVRLTLERSRSARQAVELMTDLIEAHGQSAPFDSESEAPVDNGFLIADPTEAYALETAGPHWVYQEVQQIRAVNDARTIRQDWDRISQGLAAHAIEQGWWPADGTKLDFTGALSNRDDPNESGWRRWGRATLLLEQQNGHIDAAFLRRLLGDHYEGTDDEVHPLSAGDGPVPLCRHGARPDELCTSASVVVELPADPDHVALLWCAFAPPCASCYLPVLPEYALPATWESDQEAAGISRLWRRARSLEMLCRLDPKRWQRGRESFSRFQARLDRETAEFTCEARALRRLGAREEVERLAGFFLQHNLEQFEEVLVDVSGRRPRRAQSPPARNEESFLVP